jgi:hypothetical protein
MNWNDMVVIAGLMRVACAAQTLRYAQENKPGEDLGQAAIAVCILELDAALKFLTENHGIKNYDPATYLKSLLDNGVAVR